MKKINFIDVLEFISVVVICIMPIFRYYDTAVFHIKFDILFSIILLCMVLALYFFKNRNNSTNYYLFRKSKVFLGVAFTYLFCLTFIYEIFSDISFKNSEATHNLNSILFAIIIAFIIYTFFSGIFIFSRVIKIYSAFVFLIVTIYILQYVLILFGTRISFKLPFEFTSSWASLSNQSFFGMNTKPVSLFSERSHFCEYLIPFVGICLYSNLVKKYRLSKAIIVTFCIVLTVSGNGIVIVAVEWLLYFGFYVYKKSSGKRVALIVCGLLLLFFTYYVLSQISEYSNMFDILFINESTGKWAASKADYRVYRGFDIFSQLPVFNMIVGTGYNHAHLFSLKYNIVSVFDRSTQAYEYFSSVTQMLIYSGIIGIVLFSIHFIHFFKESSKAGRGLLFVFLLLCISTEAFLNSMHLFYLALILPVAFNSTPIESTHISRKTIDKMLVKSNA